MAQTEAQSCNLMTGDVLCWSSAGLDWMSCFMLFVSSSISFPYQPCQALPILPCPFLHALSWNSHCPALKSSPYPTTNSPYSTSHTHSSRPRASLTPTTNASYSLHLLPIHLANHPHPDLTNAWPKPHILPTYLTKISRTSPFQGQSPL